MSKYCIRKCGDADLVLQIQAMSNETALSRECKMNEISGCYICDTCESSIAHKDQCVHS